MPPPTLEQLLDELDELKRPAAGARGVRARLGVLLSTIQRREFKTATTLIRFHETLLFMRAYPQSPALLRQTEKILASFHQLVSKLIARAPKDLSALEEPEVSGIAGTSFSAVFSYRIVCWLAARHPSRVRVEWEGYENQSQLAATLPLLVPLLDENAYVDNYFSLQEWLRAARGKQRELSWLMNSFESLRLPEAVKAVVYDSLKLAVRWELGDLPATRTRMKRRVRKVFFHDAPLISRRDVSLAREMSDAARLPVERLSRAEGGKLLDMGRETMTVRYRELHGFTHGDPRSVRRADAGRGVEIFLWGAPAARRFPTIAYHAALICKNGVPCGYAEALTLCERAEVGLNLFYTFREGESAWIYARLLRLFQQTLGATVFSVEPYQLGHHNKEGIESGAFWFYRKLGFRPIVPRLVKLVEREEKKMAARAMYRSPERILRELATGHLLYEAPSASRGDWDNFHLRALGLAVQRRLAAPHQDDAERARRNAVKRIERALGTSAARLNEDERHAFENLSHVLALIPDLPRWTQDEKSAVVNIIRAKAGADEARYLRLLQRHGRLRHALINLGSVRH